MTDQHLRELERRFLETGTVEDESAWLHARIRAGELEQSKLELAAYCEHQAAQAISHNPQHPAAEDFLKWVLRLGRWGRPCIVRAGLAGVHEIEDLVVTTDNRSIYQAIEDWVLCPCDPCAAVVQTRLSAGSAPRGFPPEARRFVPVALSAYALFERLSEALTARPFKTRVTNALMQAMTARAGAIADAKGKSARRNKKHRESALRDSGAELRQAIQAEIAPWALGYSDPIRERVEGRILEQ